MMRCADVHVVIASVGYGDFLRATLPFVQRQFANVTVVTSRTDWETKAIAKAHGAEAHVTNAWYRRGALFNKAAAINECIEHQGLEGAGKWVLLLDADIVLPPELTIDLATLSPANLYSARRRICPSASDWESLMAGRKTWTEFRLEQPPVIHGRVWGTRPTKNPAGLTGYFQLFNPSGAAGLRRLPESINASDYDAVFALSFPESRRHYLPLEVLHLGDTEKNWNGRVSMRWNPRGSARGPSLARFWFQLHRPIVWGRAAWATLTRRSERFPASATSARQFEESFRL